MACLWRLLPAKQCCSHASLQTGPPAGSHLNDINLSSPARSCHYLSGLTVYGLQGWCTAWTTWPATWTGFKRSWRLCRQASCMMLSTSSRHGLVFCLLSFVFCLLPFVLAGIEAGSLSGATDSMLVTCVKGRCWLADCTMQISHWVRACWLVPLWTQAHMQAAAAILSWLPLIADGDTYILFDCPGQVELFTLHDNLKGIITALTDRWHYR